MKGLQRVRSRNLLLYIVGSAFFVLSTSCLILYRYPWQVYGRLETESFFHRFVSYSPRSALADAVAERARINRFAKSEQRRRLDIQLKRMEFINATELELDSDQFVSASREETLDQEFRSFLWPYWAQISSRWAIEPVMLLQPISGGFVSRSGIRLRSGDQIRFSTEVTREPRSLIFYAFPLTESHIRGNLGKYTSNTLFQTADVQKVKRISIGLGDVTATQFKLTCLSGEVFLLFPRVTKFEQTGRLPVQLDPEDSLFEPEVGFSDEVEIVPSEVNEDEPPLIEPLDEVRNPVVKTEGKLTAVGYNIVFVNSDEVNEGFVSNQNAELAALLKSAAVTEAQIDMSGAPEYWSNFATALGRSARLFGYHTVEFAGIDRQRTLGASESRRELLGPWLNHDDAQFLDTNARWNTGDHRATGLEAIFDSGDQQAYPALNSKSMSVLAGRQSQFANVTSLLNRSGVGEQYFFEKGDGSYAQFLEAYYDWSKDQWQNRFAQFIDLVSMGDSRPSFQNLISAMRMQPSRIFGTESWSGLAAKRLSNQVLESILGTLRAKRLTHRTVVMVADTPGSQLPSKSRLRVYIPGVVAKKVEHDSDVPIASSVMHSPEELAKYALGLVGVEMQYHGTFSDIEIGREQKQVRRYRMTISSDFNSCGRLRWSSSGPIEIVDWHGVRVEGRPEAGAFDVYPCSEDGEGAVTWIQGDPANGIDEVYNSSYASLGGTLQDYLGIHDTPSEKYGLRIMFGKNALSPAELKLAEIVSLPEVTLVGQREFVKNAREKVRSVKRSGNESHNVVVLIESEPITE